MLHPISEKRNRFHFQKNDENNLSVIYFIEIFYFEFDSPVVAIKTKKARVKTF